MNKNDIFKYYLYESFVDHDGVTCINNILESSLMVVRKNIVSKYLSRALALKDVSIDWENDNLAVIYDGDSPRGEFRLFA